MELDVDGHPVVVKTASNDEASEVLEREVGRLRRARHPGVVAVSSAEPGRLALAWGGSHTLETLVPPPAVAATIVASLAATVSDLHAMGVVHGRISPAHVVVDDGGRPRLCGLRGASPDEPDIGPAEDVAALGRLIDHLLGTETDLEPIPEHRWGRKRWTGHQRRSLLTLADRATDPDAARRPTARELAAAIAEIVPEARFEHPDPALLDRALTRAGAADPVEERPAGDAAPAPDPLPVPDNIEVSTETPEPADAEPDPTVEQPEPAPDLDWDGLWADPVPDVEIGAEEPATERFLGLRLEPPSPASPPRPRPSPSPRRPERRSLPRPATVAVGLAVSFGVVALAWPRTSPTPHLAPLPNPSTAAGEGSPPSPTTPSGRCVERADPSEPGDEPRTASDPGAKVCAGLPVELSGNLIRVDGRWFEAGQAGDHVTVGDWNCDGTATPAVVRPSTGEVFVFDRWVSEDGEVTVEARGSVATAVSVEVPDDSTPCGSLDVRLADGSSVVLPSPERGAK